MRSSFGFVVACIVVSTWAACAGCGTRPCNTAQDCNPGEMCGANKLCQTDPTQTACSGPQDCLPTQLCGTDNFCHPDPSQQQGGCDGGACACDGGSCQQQTLPDGGPCVNLQCRQVKCPGTTSTTLTGSVYDPSGQVALYNAIVYVPNKAVENLPQGMTCDQCGSLVTGSPVAIALTGPDGKFELKNVPIGPNIPLVIQLGKWRRQVMVPFNVQACQAQPITDVSILHLPKNKGEGDIPQMAISTGEADRFECLLRKMGISYSEMTHPAGDGRIHFYRDEGDVSGSGNDNSNGLRNDAGYLVDRLLLGDAGTLAKYDVVLLPCRADERFGSSPNAQNQGYSQNLINYTNAGGRLFTTHYGYVWMKYGKEPWPRTAYWTPDPGQGNNPPQSPFTVQVNQSFPKGEAFAYWLWDAGASTSFGFLGVNESRHDVSGVDGGTTAWLSARNPNHPGYAADGGLSVQHLTFNTPWDPPPLPDGDAGTQCGRVVFSDFHVTTSALSGGDNTGIFPGACSPGTTMTAQEKALVFMLFDVSSCVQSDTTAPTVCGVVNTSCATASDCCAGLSCVDGTGAECFEGTCSCQVVIN